MNGSHVMIFACVSDVVSSCILNSLQLTGLFQVLVDILGLRVNVGQFRVKD